MGWGWCGPLAASHVHVVARLFFGGFLSPRLLSASLGFARCVPARVCCPAAARPRGAPGRFAAPLLVFLPLFLSAVLCGFSRFFCIFRLPFPLLLVILITSVLCLYFFGGGYVLVRRFRWFPFPPLFCRPACPPCRLRCLVRWPLRVCRLLCGRRCPRGVVLCVGRWLLP